MSAADLMADLADSAMALRAVVRQLPDAAWQVPVRVLDSAPFGTEYGPADWPAAFAAMELAEPMRSQRADRLSYPPSATEVGVKSSARSPAPWRSGQRLPGSWL